MSATTDVFEYRVDFMKELGRGGFGTVYKGYNKNKKNKPVAIKKVCKEEKTEASSEAVRFHYFKDNINHRQIVAVKSVKYQDDSMWIVMEYCDLGDLNQYFKKYGNTVMDIELKVQLMYQIISGINFLHQKNIVHRDIKPGNILVKSTQDGKPAVKLGDFGLSKILDPDCLTSAMTSNVGTLKFKAPEFWDKKLGGKVRYHRNVDVYSAGLTFAAMLGAESGKRLEPKPEGSLYDTEANMPIGFVACTRHANQQPELAVVVYKENDGFKSSMVKDLITKMTNIFPIKRTASSPVKKELRRVLHAKKIRPRKVVTNKETPQTSGKIVEAKVEEGSPMALRNKLQNESIAPSSSIPGNVELRVNVIQKQPSFVRKLSPSVPTESQQETEPWQQDEFYGSPPQDGDTVPSIEDHPMGPRKYLYALVVVFVFMILLSLLFGNPYTRYIFDNGTELFSMASDTLEEKWQICYDRMYDMFFSGPNPDLFYRIFHATFVIFPFMVSFWEWDKV